MKDDEQASFGVLLAVEKERGKQEQPVLSSDGTWFTRNSSETVLEKMGQGTKPAKSKITWVEESEKGECGEGQNHPKSYKEEALICLCNWREAF